jgi:NAD dependent epimerase/dehydratase family enzyme
VRLFAVKIVARVHFRGITAACVWITDEMEARRRPWTAPEPIKRRTYGATLATTLNASTETKVPASEIDA